MAKSANPVCEECRHPFSFHGRDPKSHRRPCHAFGCKCKKYVKPAETKDSEAPKVESAS